MGYDCMGSTSTRLCSPLYIQSERGETNEEEAATAAAATAYMLNHMWGDTSEAVTAAALVALAKPSSHASQNHCSKRQHSQH